MPIHPMLGFLTETCKTVSTVFVPTKSLEITFTVRYRRDPKTVNI